VKSRTAAYNQLKNLSLTAPDELRQTLRGKSLPRVAAESAQLRPDPTRPDPTRTGWPNRPTRPSLNRHGFDAVSF
jgi:hypothetical protein